MNEEAIDNLPLIQGDGLGREPIKRTGNVWSAMAHIITGVIGAGVLSLAWSVAQLGWIVGPMAILLFAVTTLISTFLLSDCYRYPHPENGNKRSPSYMVAVSLYLGEIREKVCGVLVYASLYGTTTAYIITSATSFR
ncbi:Amino acid transporter, transmembrane domain [Sesbania bispinosa]|nr:Amino acid transporter, transmembrane domain [Sesbania bispinosa]